MEFFFRLKKKNIENMDFICLSYDVIGSFIKNGTFYSVHNFFLSVILITDFLILYICISNMIKKKDNLSYLKFIFYHLKISNTFTPNKDYGNVNPPLFFNFNWDLDGRIYII